MQTHDLEFHETEEVPSEDLQRQIAAEIEAQPTAPDELKEKLHNYTSVSPADSGGDIDARWDEAESTGDEAVFGHSPTPDQSDSEANAHAMGLDFQDNEPLDFVEKLEKRDRDRYELDESSKTREDLI